MSNEEGIFVTFWHYIQMSDGRIEKSRDQMMFPGTVDRFKKVYPKCAVVGYHEVVDGVVTDTCVMMNETLPDLKKPNEAISGVITPELLKQAAEKASAQEKVPKSTTEVVSDAKVCQQQESQNQIQETEKIFKDGDSFIKIKNGKVFKLKWTEYDDKKADFDKRIRYADGKIMITEWEELQQ